MPHPRGTYDFTPLERVRWGEPAAQALAEEAQKRHARRALIVISPSLHSATDEADQLSQALGDSCAGIFDDLRPHTPTACVQALHQVVLEQQIDLLITLGGGTPIDTSKVVVAMRASGVTDPLELTNTQHTRIAPTLRQIACPTTLSGAEFSDLAGLTDTTTRIKHSVTGRGIGPASVILDPQLALHTPVDLWTSTGLRAIDHAVESLCSIDATPYTDALALEALRQLPPALLATRQDPANVQARLEAQLAVWMASAGLDRTPYGASHGIGHQLGAVAGVPHGICSCTMLPAVLDWNEQHTRDAQTRIAQTLRTPRASEGVRRLVSDLGLPTSLSKAGVRRDQLQEIAEKSLINRWVKTNPRPITSADDILEILDIAF